MISCIGNFVEWKGGEGEKKEEIIQNLSRYASGLLQNYFNFVKK